MNIRIKGLKTTTLCRAVSLCGLLLVAGCERPPGPTVATVTPPTIAEPSGSAAATDAVSIELPAPDYTLRESSLPGYTVATQKCIICHSTDYISLQPPDMSLQQWTAEMQKMRDKYGAPLQDAEIELVGAYLAVAYGSARQDDADVAAVSPRHADYLKSISAALP